jgi:CRP/FNR family transcriptional regulator, cyclic AMP receptor protein
MEMSSQVTPADQSPWRYLPRKPVQEFKKDQTIYAVQQGSQYLYVVMLGTVKLSTPGGARTEFIYPEGIFGESCLVAGLRNHETAVALTDIDLIGWSPEEIEAHIGREPGLGVALYRSMVRKCIDLKDRVESAALGNTCERVLLALVRLAYEAREATPHRNIRILSMTQETIAGYLGISREIVTTRMNYLRSNGVVQYSRKHIELNMEAIEEELRRYHRSMPQDPWAVTVHEADAVAVAHSAK